LDRNTEYRARNFLLPEKDDRNFVSQSIYMSGNKIKRFYAELKAWNLFILF